MFALVSTPGDDLLQESLTPLHYRLPRRQAHPEVAQDTLYRDKRNRTPLRNPTVQGRRKRDCLVEAIPPGGRVLNITCIGYKILDTLFSNISKALYRKPWVQHSDVYSILVAQLIGYSIRTYTPSLLLS